MADNMNNLENTNLTDEQTEQVSGGMTAWPPYIVRPKDLENAALTDDQLDQVSGGTVIRVKSELEKDKESEMNRGPYTHFSTQPAPHGFA